MEQADLFLRWLSERGSGPWDTVRDTARWWFGDVTPGDRSWMIAERLSDLGHIDFDWAGRRWSAAPAVINYLPPRSMLSVLCGSRTWELARCVRRLAASDEGEDVELQEISQDKAPSAWVILGTREATAAFAFRAGISFVDDAADAIANRLPPIRALLGTGSNVRGGGGDSIQVFDVDDLGFRIGGDPDRPGLYKVLGAAGPRWVYSPVPRQYHDVDLGLGVYLELSRRGKSVIHYARGEMWIPRWLPLPAAHRRCLTLCTGFLPGDDGSFLRYEAVPRVIADKVVRSLGQKPAAVVPGRRRGVKGAQ